MHPFEVLQFYIILALPLNISVISYHTNGKVLCIVKLHYLHLQKYFMIISPNSPNILQVFVILRIFHSLYFTYLLDITPGEIWLASCESVPYLHPSLSVCCLLELPTRLFAQVVKDTSAAETLI